MSTSSSASNSIGVGGLLLVAFVVLKLCKVIDWSWWWVLSPMWIPIVVTLAICAVVGTVWLAVVMIRAAAGK